MGYKSKLRHQIILGARNYRKYLVGKVFRIVCEDGTNIDIRFFPSDFKHLTGLCSNLNNISFYRNCISGSIDVGNISSEQKYNWSTLKTKCRFIEHIHEVLYKDGQRVLVTRFLDTHTFVFPYAVKNEANNICIGFVDDICRAHSLRKASTSMKFASKQNIIAIFAKDVSSERFHELVYVSSVKGIYEKDRALLESLDETIQERFLKIVGKLNNT